MTVLRSEHFDDIYFSTEDGLEEARHVFLEANNLPAAWQGQDHFVIAETGFGTGLNFLAAWDKFDKTASDNQRLDFISFEKYPLHADQMRAALSRWSDEIGRYLDVLIEKYPLRIPGFHRIQCAHNVFLTLVFGDINETIDQLYVPTKVDAWFLDGFAPAKNPDMWSDHVFDGIKQHSHNGTTLATFTAAGMVKQGLELRGFDVEKIKGFGKKRNMMHGGASLERASGSVFVTRKSRKKPPQKIAIIGGGLAGTACAYVLKNLGLQPVIFEKASHLAAAASGNATGLCNPRLSSQKTAEADFYMTAFARAQSVFKTLPESGYTPSGTLHLVTNDFRHKRLSSLFQEWGWHNDHMQWVDPDTATNLAGVPINHPAIFLPESACISPENLCKSYGEGVDIRYNTAVNDLESLQSEFDAVVLASGAHISGFNGLKWLPLHTVRGQITHIEAKNINLHTNVCYSGYVSASGGALPQVVGSTFQRWIDHINVVQDDHDENISHLREAIPIFADEQTNMSVADGRAAMRVSAKDRFPVIGRVPDYNSFVSGDDNMTDNLYINAAHGSHGLVSSLAGAYLIADMMLDAPYSLGSHSVEKLCASRFLKRDRRKGILGAL